MNSEDLDPVTYFDIERVAPYSQKLSAPYRLDCALTYRVSEGTSAAVAPNERVRRELNTDEWKTLLKNAWEAGIPHVISTRRATSGRLPIDLEAEKMGWYGAV